LVLSRNSFDNGPQAFGLDKLLAGRETHLREHGEARIVQIVDASHVLLPAPNTIKRRRVKRGREGIGSQGAREGANKAQLDANSKNFSAGE